MERCLPLYRVGSLFLATACLVAFAAPIAALEQRPPREQLDFYEREIRPLLAKRCYTCHSARAAQPAGGLRLDTPAGWENGGASGPAVKAGAPDDSLLIQAIRWQRPQLRMPPSGKLPDSEIALLEAWVIHGAHAPSPASEPAGTGARWAFQPLHRVQVPTVRDSSWCRTPIDRFILAALEKKGMRPSPPAERRTLLRRVTYDLTGLPPTSRELASFLADRSSAAYEKVVDRLLASPRYGERWARHWLDVAHYGETHGYDKDKRRDHAWPYRDYVIRAFNDDRPYSRFLREQVAGDVLFPDSPDGVVATGFLAAGPWDFVGNVELAEGTVEKEKTRVLDRDDMVATTMSTFNSVTIHCARCHDHKFDPIPQRDYYALQAVFSGVERGDRPYGDAATTAKRAALDRRERDLMATRSAVRQKIDSLSSPELERIRKEISALQSRRNALPPLPAAVDSPTNGYHSGIAARPDLEKWVQVDLGRPVKIDRIRLIPARPTDFADTPGFGFPPRYRVAVSDDPAFVRFETVADESQADVENPGTASPTFVVGKTARYARVTALRLWPRTNDYVFALAEMQIESGGRNVARDGKVTALDSIEQGRWSVRYLVDNFDSRGRLADTSDPAVPALVEQAEAIDAKLTALGHDVRSCRESLIDTATKSELLATENGLKEVAVQRAALASADLVFSVLPREPRPIHVLTRGEVQNPGEPAAPGALSCISTLPSRFQLSSSTVEGPRRAALADWLASAENALTWRSIVNRVWGFHFGRGIVDTPNDFGRNGARPSHPELLDWLATTFLQPNSTGNTQRPIPNTQYPTPTQDWSCGQSIKRLHRLIVLSAAYRQQSRDNAGYAALDGDNSLLWRMNRQRLDAEEVHDSVLAASGKLDLRMGGPGFELFRFKDDHSPVYDYTAPGLADRPETWRRAVYAFSVRSVQNPFIESLDGADPNQSTPVRGTTLTALQALALLNDPFILRQSALLAERLKRERPDLSGQIDAAYMLVLGRAPTASEKADLWQFASRHGLPSACRILFNTNEFIFID